MYETENNNKKDKKGKNLRNFPQLIRRTRRIEIWYLRKCFCMQEREKQDMLGTPDAVQDFEQKKSLMAFWWHVLIVGVDSSVDVFHGRVQIRATANFLLDEFVDKIGVLS
jgi:hypothetical protein